MSGKMPEEVIDPRRRLYSEVLWDQWEIYSMSNRHTITREGVLPEKKLIHCNDIGTMVCAGVPYHKC